MIRPLIALLALPTLAVASPTVTPADLFQAVQTQDAAAIAQIDEAIEALATTRTTDRLVAALDDPALFDALQRDTAISERMLVERERDAVVQRALGELDDADDTFRAIAQRLSQRHDALVRAGAGRKLTDRIKELSDLNRAAWSYSGLTQHALETGSNAQAAQALAKFDDALENLDRFLSGI